MAYEAGQVAGAVESFVMEPSDQRSHGDDVPSVLFRQFLKTGVVGLDFGADHRHTGRGFPQPEVQPHPGAQVLRIERLDN